MHTLTLNIKNNAYDNVVYFLNNLSNDIEITNHKINEDINDNTKPFNLRGVFNKYSNSSKIEQEENSYKNHIIEQYQKEN